MQITYITMYLLNDWYKIYFGLNCFSDAVSILILNDSLKKI